MNNGLIHVYCGDGKGKTTAATGLAVRAAGCGMKVLFVRFLKNENSGELSILDRILQIEVMHPTKSFGFFYMLKSEEQQEARIVYLNLWEEAVRKIMTGKYDMFVIDEFMAAYEYGVIPRQEALDFLKECLGKVEVVLTGRNPAPKILELAEYVSEIKQMKHPFERGVAARRGIEY